MLVYCDNWPLSLTIFVFFHETCVQIMLFVAKVAGSVAALVPLKSLLRVSEKVLSEYGGRANEVCDFVRGSER